MSRRAVGEQREPIGARTTSDASDDGPSERGRGAPRERGSRTRIAAYAPPERATAEERARYEPLTYDPAREQSGFRPRAEPGAPSWQKGRLLVESSRVRELFTMETRRAGTPSRLITRIRHTFIECLAEARRSAGAGDDEAHRAVLNRLADVSDQLGAFALAIACRLALDEGVASRLADTTRRLDELTHVANLSIAAMEQIAGGSR